MTIKGVASNISEHLSICKTIGVKFKPTIKIYSCNVVISVATVVLVIRLTVKVREVFFYPSWVASHFKMCL